MTTQPMPAGTAPAPPAGRRRRRLLRGALIGLLVLGLLGVIGTAGVLALVYASADTTNVGRLGFTQRLKIPPLAEPRLDADGRKVFDLRLQPGTTELLPGKPAETWGVNGAYLGPTLRARRGDRVVVNVTNRLPEASTLHWHGMHLPARADGGPHQLIDRGGTWSPAWTIDQPAATLWYHPHPHGRTEQHIYRGVAGLFLLDDPEASSLPLPRRYGVDDIPVVVQDKRLDDDGGLDRAKLGGDILINGTYDPHVEVASQLVRFRLLNASTARTYNVGFDDGRAFDLIGTDGGLLEAPHRTTRVPLSPGERAEIVAAFRPGDRVVLRSFEPDLGESFFGGRLDGADDTFDLLQVRAAARLRPSPRLPARLARHAPLDQAEVTTTRRMEITGSDSIDGRSMDLGRIDQVVTVGTTERWEVHNRSGSFHNFHVHDVQFKLVAYRGAAPPPALAGWKDTVPIPPGHSAHFLARFSDYADPAAPYMFHCHLLRHEDRGLMGQFVVVRPGQAPQPPAHAHHGVR
jgi:blue copper oxidase